MIKLMRLKFSFQFVHQYQIFLFCKMQQSITAQNTINLPPQAPSYFQVYLFQNHPQTYSLAKIISEQKQKLNHLIYFNALFSPRQTAQSLKKRNENLYMINFDNSDSQPDEIYNKRNKKVEQLQTKEKSQLEQLEELKIINYSQYHSIVLFMKFLSEVKSQVNKVRTDYYSTKTFCALKNSSDEDLTGIIRVLKIIFQKVKELPKNTIDSKESVNQDSAESRILEFLIIPRFLISKEKLSRLVKDEKLQANFLFLIQNQCLGHYNNEANKKMPEENQMKFVRELLKKNRGREKFKKICSINHGNKFLKNYGNCYYELYSKSFDYLKHLDNELKKGRKYNNLKQELTKFPAQTMESENESVSQESSSNTFSFRKLGDVFNNMEIRGDDFDAELRDEINVEMNKKVKRFMSTPIPSEQAKKSFRVKKSMTTEIKTTNIILIKPPHQTIKQI